ncbi:ABC transporter permease subunit [Cupriavidus sp. 2TAF22]|uniref:ABC transporter permease subunit n=1 Tax=unclassified Cupriavidus TaxID=2640874 RepID=UPI003F917B09
MASQSLAARQWTGPALVTPTLLFLAATVFVPVVLLLCASLFGAGGFSSSAFTRLASTPVYMQVLGHSLYLSAVAATVAVIAGFPVAAAISRASGGWRQLLWLGVLLPFWTSFLVRTIAWIVILGRTGVVNSVLTSSGISQEPLELLYTNFSVIVGLVHVLLPLAILTMLPILESLDRRLLSAAQTLGAQPGVTFFTVYLPLSAPGVTAAWLTTFISALGFFITPSLLGSPRQTMMAQLIIQQVQEMLDWGLAAALSVLTLVATLIIYWCYDKLVGLSTVAGEAAAPKAGARAGGRLRSAAYAVCWFLGKSLDRVVVPLAQALPQARKGAADGRGRLSATVAVIVIVALSLPVLLLIPESFTSSAFIDWPPTGFTLHWYEEIFASPLWMGAIQRSLGVAAGTAVLASVIGIPAAFAFAHQRLPLRSLVLGAILAPMILPRIIVALGLFYVLSRLGWLGSSLALVIGHTALALPYVVITVSASLRSYDRRLDDAASILGANTLTRLRRITLPIIAPGVLSAFIFAFVTSFDDLTLALFVSGGLFTTLPKQMWDDALLKVSPSLAAVSVLLFGAVLAIIAVSYLLRRKAAGAARA